MAAVALHRRTEVTGIFARRVYAVMAGRAGAKYLGMINIEYGRPCRGRVTVFAHIGSQGMLRVLASRDRAVVATETIARDVGVVVVGWQPGDRGMAVVAVIAARDMCRVLARSNDAIVAGAAAAQYLCVIHGERWYPHSAVVAVLADIRRQRMSWGLAGPGYAVMAIDAVADDARMIKIGG